MDNNSELSADFNQLAAYIQGEAMSRSMLFALSRQYLDKPLDEAPYLQPIFPPSQVFGFPFFVRVEQVGQPASNSPDQPFTALQTVLSACHAPGRYTLYFLVISDGQEHQVYLGVRRVGGQYPAKEFAGDISAFLRGNWPGTRLRPINHHENETLRHVFDPQNQSFNSVVCLTGIPSLKPGDHPGYPQSLDRLIRGMQGRSYAYMVIAEPMATGDVSDILLQCRDILGRVHPFTEPTYSRSMTQGLSAAISKSTSKSETVGFDYATLGTTLLGATGMLATAGGPVAFAAAITGTAGAGLFLYGNYKRPVSVSTSESSTWSGSISDSTTWGEKYLNVHARASEELLDQFLKRFELARAQGCWNVGVYFLSESSHAAGQAANQLRALLTGEKSKFEGIRIHDLMHHWECGVQNALMNFTPPCYILTRQTPEEGRTEGKRQVQPQNDVEVIRNSVNHPLGIFFNGLTTPITTEELTLLVNLPRREVPGVKVIATADFSLNRPQGSGARENSNCFDLGYMLQGGEVINTNTSHRTDQLLTYPLAVDQLAKHTLVTGITGSGKTNTCLKILGELSQRQIPFLVIEPAKTEYIDWAFDFNEALRHHNPLGLKPIEVYVPGASEWRGHKLTNRLAINPLDIVWLSETQDPHVLTHLDRLKSILVAGFPMQEVLPVLLEEVLVTLYTRLQWLEPKLPPYGTPLPTLEGLRFWVGEVVRGKQYADEVQRNLTAALGSRLDNLMLGWKASLFNQEQTTPWADLFERPVVINLAYLGDDTDKAFAMSVLLQFLIEYRQARQELDGRQRRDNRLVHLALFEEAHRILAAPKVSNVEQANPQGHMAEMFANLLAEIRSYGQGIMIADQVPAKLVPDAIKNTNLKIVHRLTANDDRDALAAGMGLSPEQSRIINQLQLGQAIIYGDMDDMASWVKIPKYDLAFSDENREEQ